MIFIFYQKLINTILNKCLLFLKINKCKNSINYYNVISYLYTKYERERESHFLKIKSYFIEFFHVLYEILISI